MAYTRRGFAQNFWVVKTVGCDSVGMGGIKKNPGRDKIFDGNFGTDKEYVEDMGRFQLIKLMD